ncbi:DDE superendonuclease family protein [Orientia tsutsugamushi str. Gilliam]|uniref:DDE superendonuclease family protein n=1 Tax=Orientia tsutsugamushi str. Gilliam TaxID=1359184 RepID=A0A0F3M855_ORITS|nr:IS630 family transposase [Orientia tsutsugamushi]KJV50774.1 DDE superendonuclease family protein [Orientia tsutsugamushi str. Gilliam]SPR05700.1 IS630 family transposase [Orientia tsutsugamushi str. Gilliam]SPR08431.1 IS630 family transposase [Orientia tsutsugamushi str. Gilliam]
MEAKPEIREKYQQVISAIPKENLVYIDESGIEMSICKNRGWSKKGTHVSSKKSGKYYERTNIIAGYVNNKSIAPMIFNGACNTRLFEALVQQVLINELKPAQFVVMDNAAFHKSKKTKELIESVGCKVIFLPPYSPDLNPIEKFWANMKLWIRNQITQFAKSYDAIISFFYAQTSL